MASNINSSNIDAAYPVAGTDNDSQGFRDNFTASKNNFTFAKTEIEDLQAKVLLKSALTGTSIDNDMGGSSLFAGVTRDMSETRVALGTTSGTVTIDYSLGAYQTYTMSASSTLAFSNLPVAGELGTVRVEVTVANVAHTVTFPSAVSLGIVDLMGFDSTTAAITFDTTGTFVLEFTSHDAGTTITVEDMSRARTRVEQKTATAVGVAGDLAGMTAMDATNFYVCTGTFDGSTVIWKKLVLQAI